MRRSIIGGVLAMSLGMVACTAEGSPRSSDPEIMRTWQMVSFTEDGVEQQVQEGLNTASVPVISFSETMHGDLGCNTVEGSTERPYFYDLGVLQAGEFSVTDSLCVPDGLNRAEQAVAAMLSGDTVNVNFEDLYMIWFGDTGTIKWTSVVDAVR